MDFFPNKLVLGLLLAVCAFLAASDREQEERDRYTDAMKIYGNPTLEIPRIEGSVEIDGRLDDEAWQHAPTVEISWQYSPSSNVPAKVRTIGLIMEDGDTLYVGFDARDPNPDAIRAHLWERDRLFSDDYVGIGIDTTGDSKRSFEFFSNPIGVQGDAIADDQSEDFSFDAIWDSDGQITDKGFEVEFAIPLSQLRFSKREGLQEWTLFFTRTWPRDKRRQAFQYPVDRGNSCFICQYKPAVGLRDAKASTNIQVVPTVTFNQFETQDPYGLAAGESKSNQDAGLADVRWNITPDFTFNATVNPDFSQIDADIAQSAVNESFVLFFPERRPFFLEGRDLFDTDIRLVNTRNISDPEWGAKLTGKLGANVYGLITAEDRVTNYLLAGSDSSTTTQEQRSHQATILRYRRDLKRASHIGVTLTDRHGDNYDNQVYAVDYRYRLSNTNSIAGQFARSITENPLALINDFDLPLKQQDNAVQLGYNHKGRSWSWSIVGERFGKDFRADSGFINQTDFEAIDMSLGYSWKGRPDAFVSEVKASADLGHMETNEAGDLLRRERSFRLSTTLPLNTRISARFSQYDQAFSGSAFDLSQWSINFSTRPVRGVSYSTNLSGGDQIDFANVQAGDQLRFFHSLFYHVNQHFLVNLSQTYQELDVSGGRLFHTVLSDLRLSYLFSRASVLRFSLIHRDTRRDPLLYSFDIDSRSKAVEAEFLYSYKLNPQTVFYIGYTTAGIENDRLSGLERTSDNVFVKLSYAWIR